MKAWLPRLSTTSPTLVDASLLLVRVAFGATLSLSHGVGKVTDLSGFIAKVGEKGFPVPGFLGTAAALSEFLGGLLMAVGLFTRPAAAFIGTTMLVAVLKVHTDDPFSKKELALAYMVVAIAVLVAGPGSYSVDAKMFGSKAT